MSDRGTVLTTLDLHLLDQACQLIDSGFDTPPYLVGTAEIGPTFRDVDVRTILTDEEFDALFGDRPGLWELLCVTISLYLRDRTRLPIDYQIQRMTQANRRFSDRPRNPLGRHGPRRKERRVFAGGGDATHDVPLLPDPSEPRTGGILR